MNREEEGQSPSSASSVKSDHTVSEKTPVLCKSHFSRHLGSWSLMSLRRNTEVNMAFTVLVNYFSDHLVFFFLIGFFSITLIGAFLII